MDVEEALNLLDIYLKQEKLNNLQELIFRQSWDKQTYEEIANSSGYVEEYVRENGARLWQLLSKTFNEKINKRNFKAVLERYNRQQKTTNIQTQCDWEEAVDVSSFSGRIEELSTLEQWLINDRCRLVGIFGIGGIGKTSFAVKLARQVAGDFDFLIWRSLRNASPINDLLDNLIQFLSQQQEIKRNLPSDTDNKISKLITYLQSFRCLLVLDNGETILQSGVNCGRYRPGFQGYAELFKRVSEITHQSCLMLTSREKPLEFSILEGDNSPVRSFLVSGLQTDNCQSIFRFKGDFYGSLENWQTLTHNYSGNPLALKIVASIIKDLFDGKIQKFFHQNILSFDDIEDLLSEQFNRLSTLEQEVMYWLAIEREPITLEQLQKNLLQSISAKKLFEVIKSLKRRSLIEKTAMGFTQQPVVMEYLIERQIQKVAAEIKAEKPSLLTTHALIKAETKDYLRDGQKRLTLKPLANILTENYESKQQLISKLNQITKQLKGMSEVEVGYAIGNIINLLQHLEIDLSDFDFSNSFIRQAYLPKIELHQVKLHNCHITDSVFSESLDNVMTLSFNSQGDILASGHVNGDIYLWSIPSGEKLLRLSAYQNKWFESLAFSSDDRILASANSFQSIKLWDIHTAKLWKTLPQKVSHYSSLKFLDSEILVFANHQNQVCLWNINTEKYLAKLPVETRQILSIAISSDKKKLACGCGDGIVKIWDLTSYQVIKTSQVGSSIPNLSFAIDGQSLFLCYLTKIQQWEYQTNTFIKELLGHQGMVIDLDIGYQDHLLVSASFDNTLRLWNTDTGKCLNVLQNHQNNISAVEISPNGKLLASGGYDNSIKLWSMPDGNLIKNLQGYQSTNWSLAFSPNSSQIASGFDDYSLKIWDVSNDVCLKNFQEHNAEIRSIAWSPDSQIIASGDCRGTVKIWKLDTEQCLYTFPEHTDWVTSLAFSSSGQFLASGSRDQQIIIWSSTTGERLQTLREPDGDINLIWSVAFHPDDSAILVSGGMSCKVNLWDVTQGHLIKSFVGHQNLVGSTIFSPDGKLIASGGYDRDIRIWDIESGVCLKILQGHNNIILSFAFSPDSSLLVSSGLDCTVKLWDIAKERCIKTLTESNIIISLCFNPEGTVLAIGVRSGEIKFWSLETEKYLKTLQLPRLYEQMDITGVTGLSEAQKTTLKVLGAVEF